MCNVAKNEESSFQERRKVNLVNSVDPKLERHSSGKLVSFTSLGNVVGVDLALNVDILIGSNVKELDGNQRLRVVHLSFLAIVRVVHKVKSAIRREVHQFSNFVRVFSLCTTGDIRSLSVLSWQHPNHPIQLDDDAWPAVLVSIVTVIDSRAVLQYGAVELTGALWVVLHITTVLLQEVAVWDALIIFLGLDGVVVGCQEPVQGLSVHVPALSVLDLIDNLIGLICFGSNHHAWSREPVLPSGFMVVQSLQHDVHGECKQAGQEDVENYIEEKNKTPAARRPAQKLPRPRVPYKFLPPAFFSILCHFVIKV